MRPVTVTLALMAFLLGSGAACGQTYTIKIKRDPGEGKSVLVREVDRQGGYARVLDGAGKVLEEQKPDVMKEVEYTTTILKTGQPRPLKFKRTYTKATVTQGAKSIALPYQGRTLVFEMGAKGNTYQAVAEGTPELKPEQFGDVLRTLNDDDEDKDRLFLPGKPVRVGEAWVVDARKIADKWGKDFGGEVDTARAQVTGKLLRAYEKNGQQWGTVEVSIDLPFKSMRGLTLAEPGTFSFKAVMDTAIDGSAAAGVMRISGVMAYKLTRQRNDDKRTLDTRVEFINEKTAQEQN